MKKHNWVAAGVLVLAAFSQLTTAAVSVQQAERLKGELTPLGAERAGNGKDIPVWRGGVSVTTFVY